jgi:hypothetical protein
MRKHVMRRLWLAAVLGSGLVGAGVVVTAPESKAHTCVDSEIGDVRVTWENNPPCRTSSTTHHDGDRCVFVDPHQEVHVSVCVKLP